MTTPKIHQDKTYIWITTRFNAFHRWKDAPDEVAFLRDYHRHRFHVWLDKEVSHSNRDVEFITLKKQVDEYLYSYWEGKRFDYSCEQIALDLLNMFKAHSVVVSEDGENGATVVREAIQSNWAIPTQGTPQDVYRPAGTGKEGVYPSPTPQAGLYDEYTNLKGGSEPWEAREKREEEQRAGGSTLPPNGASEGGSPPALLPSQKIRTKCFIGTEAEGPDKGRITLFVPGRISPREFLDAYNNGPDAVNTYYGAGNDRALRGDTLKEIVATVKRGTIFVEMDRFEDLLAFNSDLSPIVMTISLNPNDVESVDYIKMFSPGKVHWIGLEWDKLVCHTTDLDDKLYSQDEEI